MPFLRTFNSVYGYCVRPVIMVVFLCIVQTEKKHWVSWTLVGINTAIYLTAFCSPLTFRITDDNHYISGPLADTCMVVSAILLVTLFWQAIRSFQGGQKREMLIPLFVVAIIVISVIMDQYLWASDQPVEYLTIAVIVSCVFFYLWLHLQFVREHERDVMAQNRIKIMVSQIQPHFLYNTIATFKALCKKDPEKASEVAEKFGQYLRQNLDSLEAEGLIPVEKELEHTKLYADIEMIRFENIRVEYDTKDKDFDVPPLTIQPMVENAIRHGVRIREEGIVRVSTRKTQQGHEIEIWDNGLGFDVNSMEQAEGSHIGIRNVKERVEKLCRGTLSVESEKEKGTKITIRIPKGEGEQ
ncbi:MAG: histidine kinase [Lachnospiraceae bacterium]|nr:histidine kinase [Lachnospiraceae bacterium]